MLTDSDPRHGTPNGYTNLACRCSRCRAANTADMADKRERRRARLYTGAINPDLRAKHPDDVTHGKRATYTNWLCRCDPCTIAAKRWQADYDRRR